MSRAYVDAAFPLRKMEVSLKDLCPKCSCRILGGGPEAQEKHNDNCKSTAIYDAVQILSDKIDQVILDKLSKELNESKSKNT